MPHITELTVSQPGGGAPLQMSGGAPVGNLLHRTSEGGLNVSVKQDATEASWTLKVSKDDVAKLHDILLVCHYTVR